jgi:hypothetical protein
MEQIVIRNLTLAIETPLSFSIQFSPAVARIRVAEQDHRGPSLRAAVYAWIEVCALLLVFAQPPPEACPLSRA